MIVTLIPAAGASSRMRGKDKLLEPVRGVSILRRTAKEALAAALGPVVVGVRTRDPKRRKALRNLPVEIIEVPEAQDGLSATLKAGARWAIPAIVAHSDEAFAYSGMAVVLPDMPGITRHDLKRMNEAFQSSGGAPVRCVDQNDVPGHPTLFPLHILRDFDTLIGDKGAAALFEGENVHVVRLPVDRATRDLDTPEDWAAWRAEQSR